MWRHNTLARWSRAIFKPIRPARTWLVFAVLIATPILISAGLFFLLARIAAAIPALAQQPLLAAWVCLLALWPGLDWAWARLSVRAQRLTHLAWHTSPSRLKLNGQRLTLATDATFVGPWRSIARTLWLSVLLADLPILFTGLPWLFNEIIGVWPSSLPPLDSQALTPTQISLLNQIGISIRVYGWVIVLMRVAFVLTFIGIAVFIFAKRNNHVMAWLVSIFLLSFPIAYTVPQAVLENRAPLLYGLSELLQALSTALIFPIMVLFPNGRFSPDWTRRCIMPWLLINLTWACFPLAPFNLNYGDTFTRTLVASYIFVQVWFGLGFIALGHRYRFAANPTEKSRIRWVFFTWLVCGLMGSLWVSLPTYLQSQTRSYDGWLPLIWSVLGYAVASISTALGSVAFAIAIIRHQLWDVRWGIRRTLLYFVALGFMLPLFALLAIVVWNTLLNLLRYNPNWVSAMLLSAVLISLTPLLVLACRRLNHAFQRTRQDTDLALATFMRAAHTAPDTPTLLATLLDHALASLHIRYGMVVLIENSPLTSSATHIVAHRSLPAGLADALSQGKSIHALPFALVLPLAHIHTLPQPHPTHRLAPSGFLALGPRASDQAYTGRDTELLTRLIEQAQTANTTAQLSDEVQQQRRSPAAMAQTMVQRWQSAPESLLSEIHLLAHNALQGHLPNLPTQPGSLARAVLDALPHASNTHAATALHTLAEGYRYVCGAATQPELLATGLRLLVAALAQQQAHQWPGANELLPLFRISLKWLSAIKAAQLVEALTDAQWMQRQLNAGLFGDVQRPLAEMLLTLNAVAQSLSYAERATPPADRLRFYSQAQQNLNRAAQTAAASIGPNQVIVTGIAAAWQRVLDQAANEVRGQAVLRVVLITRQIALQPTPQVVLEISNTGLGTARQVQVALLPQATDIAFDAVDAVDAVEGQTVLADVQPGLAVRVSFALRLPPSFGGGTFTLPLRLRYADGAADEHVEHTHITLSVVTRPPLAPGQVLHNPYRPGQPLVAGSSLFVGREEDLAFLTHHFGAGAAHLVISGQHRMGKTSLLRQLPAQLHNQVITVYLDGGRLGIDPGLAGFFYDVATSICDAINQTQDGLLLAPLSLTQFADQPTHTFEAVFLPQVFVALGKRRLLLLIDEYEALVARVARGKLDADVFALLHHLMQHQPKLSFAFVVSELADQADPSRHDTTEQVSVITTALQHRIGGLSRMQAEQLITQPIANWLFYDDLAIDRMWQLTAGHPYFLQLLCWAVVSHASQEARNIVLLEHVNLALALALSTGSNQFAYIWQTCSPAEQEVMLTLSALAGQSTEIEIDDLYAKIPHIPRHGLAQATNHLIEMDVLHCETATGTEASNRISWRLEILGLWVAQQQTRRY